MVAWPGHTDEVLQLWKPVSLPCVPRNVQGTLAGGKECLWRER